SPPAESPADCAVLSGSSVVNVGTLSSPCRNQICTDEVICFGLPIRMGELQHGAAVLGCGVKYEPRALPFLAGFAEPFSALWRRHAHRVQPVNRGAIKKAQLYRARSLILRHVFAPPLGET